VLMLRNVVDQAILFYFRPLLISLDWMCKKLLQDKSLHSVSDAHETQCTSVFCKF